MSGIATDRGLGVASDPDFLKSGMSARHTGAAPAPVGPTSYFPILLENALVRALVGMPIYLNTGEGQGQKFTIYSAESARFTEFHRRRLQEAAVKFIYLPTHFQAKFLQQVEKELESVAADTSLSTSTKCAWVYETSLEVMNDALSEQRIGKNLPRLERLARAATTLVMKDSKAFPALFAGAQHDFYTATHMVNVGLWMTALAFAMGVTDKKELELACLSGLVHDVGKMMVPESILNKAGPLTEQEWISLREHAFRGADLLKREGVTSEVALRVALEHHERMDGTGYPRKITAEQIHRMSKICGVVDSFDAMTSCRPFKSNVKTAAAAAAILQTETPAKYDMDVVLVWLDLLKKAGVTVNGGPEDRLGRRAHERFSIDCPVKLHRLMKKGTGDWMEGPAMMAKAHNISHGGLGVLVDKPVAMNEYLRACLQGKGTLQNRVLEGCVVRCREYEDGCHEVGIRLCKPGEQEDASAKVMAEVPPKE